MADYIYKLGNFNTDYITSAFVTEGYVDFLNCDSDNLTDSDDGPTVIVHRERTASKHSGKATYDFAFIPDISFLSNAEPLLKNCELRNPMWQNIFEVRHSVYRLEINKQLQAQALSVIISSILRNS